MAKARAKRQPKAQPIEAEEAEGRPSINGGKPARIRTSLRFSPQPQPTAVKVSRARPKKVAVPLKRGSLGGVAKIQRTRKAPVVSKAKQKVEEDEDEDVVEEQVLESVVIEEVALGDFAEEQMIPTEEEEDVDMIEQEEAKQAQKEKPETSPSPSPVKERRARASRAKPVKETVAPKKAAPVKKAAARTKKDQVAKQEEARPHASENVDFTIMKIASTINECLVSKSMTFQGTYGDHTAVLRLEKMALDEATVKKALSDKATAANQDFANDIYSSHTIYPEGSAQTLSGLKATFICPASESVLAKYTRSEATLFSETPDAYLKVVEPFIQNKLDSDKGHNTWVYNILDGKSEANRVVFNDPDPDSGFMIVPDLKFSGDETDLKLLAICHRRDIRSLRDLTDKHLVLLKNIMTKGTKVVKDKFKKIKGQLRLFIHYQPTFYHFHVHFRSVDPSNYLTTDRDNLLSTVINNISLVKDYYKKSTLLYPLPQSNPLYQELKKAKRV